MDIVKITFNDNTVHEYKKGTSFYDASKDYNMNNIVGYKINNEVFSLDTLMLYMNIVYQGGCLEYLRDQEF